MSMYTLFHGRNPQADAILAMLNLTKGDFARFRDVFVTQGQIAVYTRLGGGNRDSYEEVFESMSKHPNYLDDRDDDFDSTYCTFYFSFPDAFKDELSAMDRGEWSGDKAWDELFQKIKQAGKQ